MQARQVPWSKPVCTVVHPGATQMAFASNSVRPGVALSLVRERTGIVASRASRRSVPGPPTNRRSRTESVPFKTPLRSPLAVHPLSLTPLQAWIRQDRAQGGREKKGQIRAAAEVHTQGRAFASHSERENHDQNTLFRSVKQSRQSVSGVHLRDSPANVRQPVQPSPAQPIRDRTPAVLQISK